MKNHPIVAIILFMVSMFSFGQENKFDSVYNSVSNETIRMKWAINVADSLYNHAQNEDEKSRSLMLAASLLYRSGMTNEALEKAKLSNEIAQNAGYYNLQARVCGLISTIYRVSGLYAQGKIYLEQALKASEKIKDTDESLRFQGNLHQEMAYYSMDEMNFQEAVEALEKGMKYFEKLSDENQKNFAIATNKELLAKNYIKLKQYQNALLSYENALVHLERSEQKSALEGFIYNGMGNVLLIENNLQEAQTYLFQALEIAESSQFAALQDEVYQSLMQYYKLSKNQEKYVEINEKFLTLRSEFEKSKNLSTNTVVNELQTREKSAIFNFYTIASLSFVLILIFIASFFYLKSKRKKEVKQFQTIIEELKEKSLAQKIKIPQPANQSVAKDLIPEETERKLLSRLEEFEKTQKYLEKGFSLPMLAVELETNTKYLSRIINKHRKSDFNTYINRLKIEYIIKKLHDEPVYANYKISYLADECGFSSHSKFTTIFKSETGVLPTVFLSLLEKERKKTNT